MAPKGDVKGFYRQRKKGGITKPLLKVKAGVSSSSSSCSYCKTSLPSPPASLGSDFVQPPALISHGSLDPEDDYDEHEEVLRQFDMNMAYGPCLGMSRMARWERANSLGLNPPKDVERLLRGGKTSLECLWDGRV